MRSLTTFAGRLRSLIPLERCVSERLQATHVSACPSSNSQASLCPDKPPHDGSRRSEVGVVTIQDGKRLFSVVPSRVEGVCVRSTVSYGLCLRDGRYINYRGPGLCGNVVPIAIGKFNPLRGFNDWVIHATRCSSASSTHGSVDR